jgi:hypothetical protein
MYQLMLFHDMLPEYIHYGKNEEQTTNFQVCSMTDHCNKFSIKIEDGQDPESVALEKLGYFVVPECSYN